MRKLLAAVALALLAPVGAASAATVLDQQNVVAPSFMSQLFSTSFMPFRLAQSLTVGITGTLSDVDIEYYGSSSAFSGFDILAVGSNGKPTGTVLGTGSLKSATTAGNSSPGWASFTTSLAVTTGEKIAIEPFISKRGAGWAFAAGGYAGGDGFNSSTSLTAKAAFIPEYVDLGFRTFVTTVPTLSAVSPLPELDSWAMMIGGLGLVGGTLRRARGRAIRLTVFSKVPAGTRLLG